MEEIKKARQKGRMLHNLNKSQNHSMQENFDSSNFEKQKVVPNKSIRLSTNFDVLNDYEKLSTTYHEYIRGNDITNDIDNKRRSISKRKFKKNISDAKKRLSRLKKLTDFNEHGILQTISPDCENSNPLVRHSINGMLKKEDGRKKLNLHTSMSVSPDSHSFIPVGRVKSTFGNKKKKLNFNSRMGAKNNKKLYMKMSNIDKKDTKRTKVSSGSISKGSTKELDKINSLILKLKEVTRVKENLAIDNQSLKFKLAELQREKYSLSKLNKKLSKDSKRSKTDTDFIVLNKKEYEAFKKRYSIMAKELEEFHLMFSDISQSSILRNQIAESYLHNALQLEDEIRRFKIKESLNTQNLETKIKLLKETLTNRNKEFREYEGVQKNNEQLLSLLEKYDDKVTELQTEIDIRDLKIEQLEGKEKKYNLKSLEDRVQFLIDLLEKCKHQLGYISDTDTSPNDNYQKNRQQEKLARGKEIFANYQRHIKVEDQDLRTQERRKFRHVPRNQASIDSLIQVKREALTSNCCSVLHFGLESLI
ncbi:unnamed protein product [Moneuplotes crassus]|uniref:Uncharacterized protein n=1 Tax=Euplotes crassus TaxID=5936 RepID=A0AAD1U4V4_EUPCR|nr:unnamed protein product [Moneuplotes crassus]